MSYLASLAIVWTYTQVTLVHVTQASNPHTHMRSTLTMIRRYGAYNRYVSDILSERVC